MKLKRMMTGLLMGLVLALGSARADQQELQVGYVFNSWTSNSLFHGNEHRVPVAYTFTSPDLSVAVNTAFVAGDYVQDAASTAGITGNQYQSSQFSDTTLGARYSFSMNSSVRLNFSGTLNIPTGDNRWELAEQAGAIPVVFEPTFYHGGGWGGNLFYTVSTTKPGFEYEAGLGYVATSIFDTGLSTLGTFSPGDNLVALTSMGFRMSDVDTMAFRYVHTFPMESVSSSPQFDFTEGQGNIFSSQWLSQMGTDKLAVNASYSFYGTGSTANGVFPYVPVANSGASLGDKLEIHPVMGYTVVSGVVLESGLLFDWIQPNGYTPGPSSPYEGGGFLFGAEQSLTFQLSPGTFWNLAGLYHNIANLNAGGDTAWNQTVTYQRFTLGTNVGFKW